LDEEKQAKVKKINLGHFSPAGKRKKSKRPGTKVKACPDEQTPGGRKKARVLINKGV